jgi:hypothetical protein
VVGMTRETMIQTGKENHFPPEDPRKQLPSSSSANDHSIERQKQGDTAVTDCKAKKQDFSRNTHIQKTNALAVMKPRSSGGVRKSNSESNVQNMQQRPKGSSQRFPRNTKGYQQNHQNNGNSNFDKRQYRPTNQNFMNCKAYEEVKPLDVSFQPESFKFTISSEDSAVSERTAKDLYTMQQCIEFDRALDDRLNSIVWRNNQWLLNQQQSHIRFCEDLRELQVRHWLESRTEEERQQYYQRTAPTSYEIPTNLS